jgi:hypothetical protein
VRREQSATRGRSPAVRQRFVELLNRALRDPHEHALESCERFPARTWFPQAKATGKFLFRNRCRRPQKACSVSHQSGFATLPPASRLGLAFHSFSGMLGHGRERLLGQSAYAGLGIVLGDPCQGSGNTRGGLGVLPKQMYSAGAHVLCRIRISPGRLFLLVWPTAPNHFTTWNV